MKRYVIFSNDGRVTRYLQVTKQDETPSLEAGEWFRLEGNATEFTSLVNAARWFAFLDAANGIGKLYLTTVG